MPGLRRILTVGSRAGEGGTLVGLGIDIQGLPELQAALGKLSGPQMGEALFRGTKAGANHFKKSIKAEAPTGGGGGWLIGYKRTGGKRVQVKRQHKPGNLKASVSFRKARGADRGYVISPRPKIAFYRHMVVKGTQPHRIRFPNQKKLHVPKAFGRIQHPGSGPNPFVMRGYEAARPAAEQAVMKAIEKYVKKVWAA